MARSFTATRLVTVVSDCWVCGEDVATSFVSDPLTLGDQDWLCRRCEVGWVARPREVQEL
jgi:hypothetical protein